MLDATPTGNLAFLVKAFGKPFTSNGFGNWFRKQCDEAGLKHCSAHGLRKAGAALAAENGATERQLMAIFGWTTMKEASRYSRAAPEGVGGVRDEAVVAGGCRAGKRGSAGWRYSSSGPDRDVGVRSGRVV